MEERMIALCRAFTMGEDFLYDGMMIGKVKYEQLERGESEYYESEVVKNNGKLCIITCSGYREKKLVEVLTVYLMMIIPAKNSHQVEVKESQEAASEKTDEEVWRCFAKEVVRQFSQETGDKNSIHLTQKPIVQGLFILKELCKTFEPRVIEVKYLQPVYGEENVYLDIEENGFKGMSKGKLCFKGTYKK